eukprot:TRINITY_DN3142_c0_g1_i1.p1 TRINITY_DN3142_c0_g1~~TRINITY_DN3142_c0_g1_i1.p1  ORF type:complete len:578 (-),score=75.79 TRINITY_DN3142_c0_g1_i1:135-1868(-)
MRHLGFLVVFLCLGCLISTMMVIYRELEKVVDQPFSLYHTTQEIASHNPLTTPRVSPPKKADKQTNSKATLSKPTTNRNPREIASNNHLTTPKHISQPTKTDTQTISKATRSKPTTIDNSLEAPLRRNGYPNERICSSTGHYKWVILGRKNDTIYRYPIPVGYWSTYDKKHHNNSYLQYLGARRLAFERAGLLAKQFDSMTISQVQPITSYDPHRMYSVKDTFIGQKVLEPKWLWVENISIVYTWVNGSEAVYRKQKAQTLRIPKVTSRDRNNNELLYSLRALQRAIPWHKGMIYLVSPKNHVPNWIRTDHPRLRIVNQDTIVPKKFQPTFNTNCIESWLHRIPNITNKFIYMNDEFYMYGAYIHPSAFFTPEGYPRLYQSLAMFAGCNDDQSIRQESESRWVNHSCWWMRTPYNSIRKAGLTASQLMDALYGRRFRYYPRHAPYVFSIDALKMVRETFPSAYLNTCRHKMRSGTDVSTTFMHHQFLIENFEIFRNSSGKVSKFGYCLAGVQESFTEAVLIMLGNTVDMNAQNFRKLLDVVQPFFFTLNDDFSLDEVAVQMKTFLQDIFPTKSFAEL